MNENKLSQKQVARIVYPRFLMALIVLPLVFFLPAWTFNYWEAWVYIVILLTPMFILMQYLIRNQPDLIIRRMQFSEKEDSQKKIIKLAYIPFLLAFILPGFDHRLGWSNVPVWVVILAEILVLVGYGITILVFRENQYASRIVEVAEEQKVIDTGPYAIVRHPMYVGTLLLYVLTPLALGSYWAIIPAALIIPVIIARTVDEEKILTRDLTGYTEYTQKTRYRLIPDVW
ncbi:MAG: isoprenylcysteine carboxylmethyltransferase family protein [Anaerolineaceae bacterium]|nr:isoprenylcysteine carboxylmethyltransferase family protein [Anaerolineaceae bacterium]